MSESKYKKALYDALSDEYKSSVTAFAEDHTFSDDFERKMNKLVKRRRKPYYPIINTVSKRAACIVAAVVVAAFSTVMNVNAFRESFKEFIVWIQERFSVVSVNKDNDTDSYPDEIVDVYEITYDLSGYVIELEENEFFIKRVVYYNEAEDTEINYSQNLIRSYNALVNTEGAVVEKILINGNEGIFYTDNHGYGNLIWNNDEYVFDISANLDKETLLSVAESVKKVEKQ